MTKTLLRWNDMCFEYLMEDKGIQYQILFCIPESYNGQYFLFEKDGKGAPDEIKTIDAVQKLRPKGCFDSMSSIPYFRTQALNDIKKNIKLELESYHSATSANYKSYLAASILYDISYLPNNSLGKELVDNLDIFTNIKTTSDYYFLNRIDEHIKGMRMEMKSVFYCALAMSKDLNISDRMIPNIVKALQYGIQMKRTDLRPLLIRYPVFSLRDDSAEFLMSQYGGDGIKPDELIAYYIEKNDSKKLYDSIMGGSLSAKNDNYSLIEILRFLCSHGYSNKKNEIARKIILDASDPKEYFALRQFVTKEELLEEIESHRFYGSRKPVAYFIEDEQIKKAVNMKMEHKSSFYYYSIDYVEAYGYDPKHSYSLDEYQIKDARKEVREEMSRYAPEFINCYKTMIGLILSNDKTSYTYLGNDDSKKIIDSGTFSIVRAIANETSGKKFKTMHLYKGGN